MTQAAMAQGFGYEYCSPVQEKSIPVSLQGFDVLARARTGTGKTLGFLIPAIESLVSATQSGERRQQGSCAILVLSPTRELSTQISDEAKKLLRFHQNIGVSIMMGGTNADKERRQMGSGGPGPQLLLVATPGRLEDHLYNTPGFRARFDDLRTFVLDEADQMLDMGFRPTITKILAALPPPAKRQTLLFSATVPKEMQQIASKALRPGDQQRFVDCVGEGAEQTATKLEQFWLTVPLDSLLPAMWNVISGQIAADPNHKIIVFFVTARCTQFFAEFFNAGGIPVMDIHSRKSQSARSKTSEKFRDAKQAVLFTSDVSARGMDYPDVTFVLQVGAPSSKEQYVHRTGRSARAGKSGVGMLLLCDWETFFLRDVRDLPLKPWQGGSIPLDMSPGLSRATAWVKSQQGLSEEVNRGAQAYQAWLGYYNGLQRKIGASEPPKLSPLLRTTRECARVRENGR